MPEAAASPIDTPLAWRRVGVAFATGFIACGAADRLGLLLAPLMAVCGGSHSRIAALDANTIEPGALAFARGLPLRAAQARAQSVADRA